MFCQGTKFGCVDQGEVAFSGLCPDPESSRPQYVSASYGSYEQVIRHVCSGYPPKPNSGWPLCTNNSVELITSEVSSR